MPGARKRIATTPEERTQQRLAGVERKKIKGPISGNAEQLRMIRGRANSNSATPLSGAGFTLTVNAVGQMTVTYTNAFPTSQIPSVNVTCERTAGGHNVLANIENSTNANTGFRVILTDANAAFATVDTIFNFQVQGPPS